MICTVEKCDKPSRAGGMCTRHYQRTRKYGDPNFPVQPNTGRFQTGQEAHNKGKSPCEVTKQKLRLTNVGKIATDETRRKMSASRKGRAKSPETRLKMSVAATGRPKSAEARSNMSKAKKGKPGRKCSDANKTAISIAQKARKHVVPQGKACHFYGKPPKHKKRIEYQGVLFRSSWEVRFVMALNVRNISWEYEPKSFDLGNCTYTPDFYLPELECYWEIKGWFHTESQLKVQRFRNMFPEIPLVVANLAILKMMEFGTTHKTT